MKGTIVAKTLEKIETRNNLIDAGEFLEGFLNSYHLLGCWSMQVEVQEESGGVGSGIMVVNVPIEKDSMMSVEEFEKEQQVYWDHYRQHACQSQ